MSVQSIRDELALNAATDWILAELDGEPASVDAMRAVALKELKRPRSATHRIWSEIFLEHVKQFERAKTIAGASK